MTWRIIFRPWCWIFGHKEIRIFGWFTICETCGRHRSEHSRKTMGRMARTVVEQTRRDQARGLMDIHGAQKFSSFSWGRLGDDG